MRTCVKEARRKRPTSYSMWELSRIHIRLETDRKLVVARGWGFGEMERMARGTTKATEFLFQVPKMS